MNYLQTISDLPWNVKDPENLDTKVASDILERDHFGLDQVKTRII
jgi:ATP-dependent Lon protease